MKKQSNKNLSFTWKNELMIALIIVALSVLGAVLTYSVQIHRDYMAFHTMGEHLLWTAIGVFLMLLCRLMDLKKVKKFTPVIGGIAIILMFLLKTPLGIRANGTTRWLDLGWFNVRPEAVLIFAYILFIACVTAYFYNHANKYQMLNWVWGTAAITAFLITGITDNMSIAVLVLGIAFIVTFVFANMKMLHLLLVLVSGSSMALYIHYLLKEYGDLSFRMMRLKVWLDPYTYEYDQGYMTVKQLEAIKSGGLFGKGLGKGALVQNSSGAYSDGFFALICEEFGWLAAGVLVLVIIFLLYLIYRVVRLALEKKETFGAAVTTGILAHMGLSMFGYIARNLNLLPKGSGTFLFVSYLGVSGLVLFCEIGLVLAAARKCQSLKV